MKAFPRWHYEFDLRGIRTPIFDPAHRNRHEQRRRYFFDPVVEDFDGRRVLDLGCNAGWWSLLAVEAGCDYVLGLDGRAMHTEQAELVFEASGVATDRYDFVTADVFEFDARDRFDVVLCLGLLYHVAKPVELFERMAAWTRSLLIVDTHLSRAPGSTLELRREDLPEDPRAAVGTPLVTWPTREAVLMLARVHGFTVETPIPRFTDWTGCEDYRDGDRLAFICRH